MRKLDKKGERKMERKCTNAFVANTSLERRAPDADDNVQNPGREAVEQSKRDADDNEK